MTTIAKKGKIITQDIAYWDGVEDTFSRRDSTGGTIGGVPVGNMVDVLHAYGNGTNYTYGTIKACTDKIGTTRNRTLLFRPGTWVIDQNLTIAANFTCRIPHGVVFSVASGVTLTFSGATIRDSNTWTSGSGTVTESGTNYFGNDVSVGNDLTVANDATVTGNTSIAGNATISGTASITSATTIQAGLNACTASGTDTYTGTLSPAIAAYTTRALYNIYFTNANTSTTPTLELNSLGAKTIKRLDGSALLVGDINANYLASLYYDGTDLLLVNPYIRKFRGALVRNSSAQSIPTGSSTAINFDTESYDTDNIHDNSTNNTRLTVPAGVTKCRISAKIDFAGNSTGERTAIIALDGAAQFFGNAEVSVPTVPSPDLLIINLTTAIVSVSAGQYFEVLAVQNSGGNLNVNTFSWLAMEIIE